MSRRSILVIAAVVALGLPAMAAADTHGRDFAAPGNARDVFLASAIESCQKSFRRQVADAGGSPADIHEDRLVAYCTCFATKVADSIPSDEMLFDASGVPAAALREKMEKIANTCIPDD